MFPYMSFQYVSENALHTRFLGEAHTSKDNAQTTSLHLKKEKKQRTYELRLEKF